MRIVESLQYRVEFTNRLIEHEYDHVFFGRYDGFPIPHSEEADDWKWMDMAELGAELKVNPGSYTFWFAASFDRVAALRGIR